MRFAELRRAIFAAIVAVTFPGPAWACTISAAPVNFGAYAPSSASERLGYGTVNVTCPGTASPTAQLSISAGASASFLSRRMNSGANALQYNLYTSSAVGAPVWGDGSGGSVTVTIAGANATTATTVYGRIPAQQNVQAGTYSDTMIVTVTF